MLIYFTIWRHTIDKGIRFVLESICFSGQKFPYRFLSCQALPGCSLSRFWFFPGAANRDDTICIWGKMMKIWALLACLGHHSHTVSVFICLHQALYWQREQKLGGRDPGGGSPSCLRAPGKELLAFQSYFEIIFFHLAFVNGAVAAWWILHEHMVAFTTSPM